MVQGIYWYNIKLLKVCRINCGVIVCIFVCLPGFGWEFVAVLPYLTLILSVMTESILFDGGWFDIDELWLLGLPKIWSLGRFVKFCNSSECIGPTNKRINYCSIFTTRLDFQWDPIILVSLRTLARIRHRLRGQVRCGLGKGLESFDGTSIYGSRQLLGERMNAPWLRFVIYLIDVNGASWLYNNFRCKVCRHHATWKTRGS